MKGLPPVLKYSAISVIAMFLVLFVSFYSVSGTDYNPILAFEFADSNQEVLDIFMPDGEFNVRLIQGIDLLNALDFMFAASYTVFLFMFFAERYMKMNRPVFGRGSIFVLIAFIAEIGENISLFSITQNLINIDVSEYIPFLQVFTSIKWMALSLVFVDLFGFFRQQDSKFSYASYLFFLPLILGIAAVVGNELILEIIWANSVFAVFFIFIIGVFLPSNAKIKPQKVLIFSSLFAVSLLFSCGNTDSSSSQKKPEKMTSDKTTEISGTYSSIKGVKNKLSCYCYNGGYLITESGERIAVCFKDENIDINCERVEISGKYVVKKLNTEPGSACKNGKMKIFEAEKFECLD